MQSQNGSPAFAYRRLEHSSQSSLPIRQRRGLCTIAQLAESLVGKAIFFAGTGGVDRNTMVAGSRWCWGETGELCSRQPAGRSIPPERVLWRDGCPSQSKVRVALSAAAFGESLQMLRLN